MVTSWSPHGHLVVTSWSPRGHLVVTSCPLVPPRGRPKCLSVVICQWFDPYKLGDCASWSHIWRPPALIGFLGECAGPLWGDSGEVTRIYTSRDIGPKNSPRVHPEFTPSSPRVHPEFTCSPPLALPLARVRGVEPRVAVLETAVLPLH